MGLDPELESEAATTASRADTEELDESWELLESRPSERLLPQPRTVIATEPVSKRTAAFPVAGMMTAPTPVPRFTAASPPCRDPWDSKAAREKSRGRFLKDKAVRAAKLRM